MVLLSVLLMSPVDSQRETDRASGVSEEVSEQDLLCNVIPTITLTTEKGHSNVQTKQVSKEGPVMAAINGYKVLSQIQSEEVLEKYLVRKASVGISLCLATNTLVTVEELNKQNFQMLSARGSIFLKLLVSKKDTLHCIVLSPNIKVSNKEECQNIMISKQPRLSRPP